MKIRYGRSADTEDSSFLSYGSYDIISTGIFILLPLPKSILVKWYVNGEMQILRETDEILYNRFMDKGDEKALGILMDRHKESLTLFLYSYVHNMEDAEDLMLFRS